MLDKYLRRMNRQRAKPGLGVDFGAWFNKFQKKTMTKEQAQKTAMTDAFKHIMNHWTLSQIIDELHHEREANNTLIGREHQFDPYIKVLQACKAKKEKEQKEQQRL